MAFQIGDVVRQVGSIGQVASHRSHLAFRPRLVRPEVQIDTQPVRALQFQENRRIAAGRDDTARTRIGDSRNSLRCSAPDRMWPIVLIRQRSQIRAQYRSQ